MMAGGYPVDATLTGADASRIDLMGSDLVFSLPAWDHTPPPERTLVEAALASQLLAGRIKLDGIIGKRAAAPYCSGRSTD